MSNSATQSLVPLRDPVAEPLRRGQQLRVRLVIEQVEKQRIGELVVRPGRLGHAARPEQEEAGWSTRGYISPSYCAKTTWQVSFACRPATTLTRRVIDGRLVIRSFRSKDTEALFADLDVLRFRALQDLRVSPSNRLEALKGDRK